MLGKLKSAPLARKTMVGGFLIAALGIAGATNAALVITLTDTDASPPAPASVNPAASGGTVGFFTYSNFTASAGDNSVFGILALNSGELINNTPNPHTISVEVADDGFTLPGSAGSTLGLFGSYAGTYTPQASGLAVSMSTYVDAANHPDASVTPTAVGSSGTSTFSFGPPDFSTHFQGSTAPTTFTRSSIGAAPYSLSGIVTLTIPGNGGQVDFSDNEFTISLTNVPEPASLGMGALSGLLLMRRRRTGK